MDILRVLILEDDEDIIELVSSVLEPSCECFSAGNGLEGLQQVRDGEPDVIVCDIMMPVMDGWAFIQRLHQLPEYAATPVIFLSALSSQEHIRNGYKEGAGLYLTKPIDPARFKRNFDLFVDDRGITPRPKHKRIDQLKVQRLDPHSAVTPVMDDPLTPPWAALQQPSSASVRPPAASPRPVQPAAPTASSAPAGASGAPARPQAPRPTPAASAPATPRIRLLLVEDDRDTCTMITAALQDRFELLVAGDGIAAIEQAVRYKPDIFVIDGMLPRMTGYQLTVMLKKNIEFYRSPIIFMSGKATPRDQQYAQSLGINYFLPKPFTTQQFTQILDQIIRQPDFTIHKNRVEFKQISLEYFQHIETHRSELPKGEALEQLERRYLENSTKKPLH